MNHLHEFNSGKLYETLLLILVNVKQYLLTRLFCSRDFWNILQLSRVGVAPVHSRQEGVNFVSKQTVSCIVTGMQNPSKWGIYREILTRASRVMATLIYGQECLKTTFINVFGDFFHRLWNNWSFLTILEQFWWLKIQISVQNGHAKNEILQ